MTSQSLTPRQKVDLPALQSPGTFDSSQWLKYFEENRKVRPALRLPNEIVLEEAVQAPLIRSLQRFQIGETGEGHHLRKYAKKYGDPNYAKCVDLFIKEEQSHAQVLSQVILSMNGSLLTWHWTDLAFIALRRVLHLKTELLIILIAEVIGKCFYKYLADNVAYKPLEEVFSLIVLDEIMHLKFHTEFLSEKLNGYPWLVKHFVHYIWCLIFYTACFAFVADHKKALSALGVTSGDFIATCSKTFHVKATRALGL
ncbi:MAG: hypothetical protein K2X93_07270 [Candidatus Obscuribacterales bacterium]|nr:hypothetical protein [Candidatus Obscuribacterales bacterium]